MPLPLSAEQRRLWFIDQVSPGIVAYNVDAAYRLRGPLDVGALQSAVRYLLTRHEVLRSRFTVVDGEPHQVVGDLPTEVLSSHDLSAAPDAVARARELARAQANRPFALTEGPLFRAWLARLNQHDNVLGIVVHHAVFDRESLDVWASEISAAYAAFCRGGSPALPALRAQYADFVEWQRQRATTDSVRGQRDYWRDRLRAAPMLVDLPTDRRRPARPSHRAGQVAVCLAAPDTSGLRRLVVEHRTTMFTVALAGFQGLLLRYSPGADGVVVGCPVNGRAHVEFEGLIGFFAKSLPIVADLSHRRDPTFSELVAHARDALLAAHAHQDVPFDEIVRLAAPPRDLDHNPLFQVWFDLVSAGPTDQRGPRLPGVAVSDFDTEQVRTRFDLELHLNETTSGELSGRLLFATDLFDVTTARGFVRHYQNFLAAVAKDPAMRLSEVPILSADERNQIVSEWGAAR